MRRNEHDIELKQSIFVNIELRPRPGTDITDMIKEAMVVSIACSCNVSFKHNDTPYLIDYEKMKLCIKEGE